MALTRVTITAALGPADTLVRFVTSSLFTPMPGDLAYIDREAMELLFQPFPGVPALWKVQRGSNGTAVAPHAVNNQIYVGKPGEFAFYSPQGAAPVGLSLPFINVKTGDQFVRSSGGSWQKVGDEGVPLQPAWASGSVAEYTTAGPITIQNGTSTINSATARAMTLAPPIQGDDGTVMTIIGDGGGAHTVTVAAGFNGAGGAYDVATFAATGGTLTLQVINGQWRVLSAVGVTIA